MKKLYALIVTLTLVGSSIQTNAQGCVAVRNIVGATTGILNESKTWQISANYRYFHSYKHFVGNEEQTQRVAQHTNVINNDHSVILGANYTFNSRWSISLSVPFLYINRSSLYEHYGNSSGQRFSSSANGLGDIRIVTNYLLINKSKSKLLVGAGVKLPSGNFRYQDQFHKLGSQGQDSLVTKYVDQSIQPGDGGLGIILDYNFNQMFTPNFSLYSNGMYMSNPRNTNGVQRSSNAGTIPLSNEFSVVDQFFVRLGVQYQVKDFAFALGGRAEGIPVNDLIGRSDGFRRPGFIISAEPSIFYTSGNHFFALNVPVALVRNRTQSTIDKARSIETRTNVHGDAAFADFLVSISYALRINKKVSNPFGTGSGVIK